jgi:hypothetical protein
MKNFEIGQKVEVVFGVIDGGRTWTFESEIVDVVDNHRNQGVWVDHPELRGEDMLFVELTNPNVNSVEVIQDQPEVERYTSKETEMKEAKKVLQKAFKWEEEEITVKVKIYDCFEDNTRWGGSTEQSYDVEIMWAFGDEEYTDCVVVDSYYSTLQDDEVALKDAKKRATAVLRTVKGWFQYDDQVNVVNGVEVYHA